MQSKKKIYGKMCCSLWTQISNAIVYIDGCRFLFDCKTQIQEVFPFTSFGKLFISFWYFENKIMVHVRHCFQYEMFCLISIVFKTKTKKLKNKISSNKRKIFRSVSWFWSNTIIAKFFHKHFVNWLICLCEWNNIIQMVLMKIDCFCSASSSSRTYFYSLNCICFFFVYIIHMVYSEC